MQIVGDMIAELMPLINQLTNWQRNQWAKDGYSTDPRRIQWFLGLKKP